MPFGCLNMLTDRQQSGTIGAGGTSYFIVGRRFVDLADIQYCKINYRGVMVSGTAALRVEWSPEWDRVNFYTLVPNGPSIDSSAAQNITGDWVDVGETPRKGGDLLLRTVIQGTPSATYDVMFCSLMYR